MAANLILHSYKSRFLDLELVGVFIFTCPHVIILMPHAEDFQIKYNVQGKVSFRVCSSDSLSAICMLRNCSIFTKIKILDVIYDASTALGSVTAWDGTTAASHTLQV